jgi:hypothetical protein
MADPCIMLADIDFTIDFFTLVDSTVRVFTEEVSQPVVDVIWYVQLGKLLKERRMPHSVEYLAEIKCYHDDVWICEEHDGDGIEDADYCCSRGASRSQSKLVGERLRR